MSQPADSIDDILVVGGGDVGLITALAVRKLNPDLELTVVDDFSEDPPNVGKSTYQSILDILHGFLQIPEERFLREVKPIWKGSVYFRDWCDCDPFHYTFDFFVQFPDRNESKAAEQLYYHYDEVSRDPEYRTVSEAMVESGKSPIYFDSTDHSRFQAVAYHLDLARFNSFLAELCEERGITLLDDEVTAVETDGQRVCAVRGDDGTYRADLYVDASGFNRVLKDELDPTFRDFDLPLDSAFNAKSERELSEAVPATVVESGDAGWFWQIDTFDYRDRGYVFSSEFVTDEEAKAEFLKHCGDDVSADDLTKYEFTSGYYTDAWQGNCVSIGNAEGFVEPLQSTALTANAQAAANLAILLSAQGRADPGSARELYNAWVSRLWESIYDFVSIHYRYADGETPFWRSVQSLPVSSRVTRLEEHFDTCGYNTTINPVQTPLQGEAALDDLVVFAPINFYIIMRNMGAESSFYEENSFEVSDALRAEIDEFYGSLEGKADELLSIEEVYTGLMQVA